MDVDRTRHVLIQVKRATMQLQCPPVAEKSPVPYHPHVDAATREFVEDLVEALAPGVITSGANDAAEIIVAPVGWPQRG